MSIIFGRRVAKQINEDRDTAYSQMQKTTDLKSFQTNIKLLRESRER